MVALEIKADNFEGIELWTGSQFLSGAFIQQCQETGNLQMSDGDTILTTYQWKLYLPLLRGGMNSYPCLCSDNMVVISSTTIGNNEQQFYKWDTKMGKILVFT